MLSTKRATFAIHVLSLCLLAALSFFVATETIPKTDFITNSLETVENSSRTVMKLSAATLSTSLAISALPDDFATPLAQSLADMNIYFIALLTILLFEKILILYGIKAAFTILIPFACFAQILSLTIKKDFFRGFALRLCILGLAVAFVVPCSTHLSHIVAADLAAYVEDTIQETKDGANKLNEAMDSSNEEKTIFETLSDLFQTAIRDISDLMLHFQNTVRRCMNSIAILILTNCLMPLLTFFLLRWILKETFQIVVPLSSPKKRRPIYDTSHTEFAAAGEERP